jgi:phytoene dehydrogenase-like protein
MDGAPEPLGEHPGHFERAGAIVGGDHESVHVCGDATAARQTAQVSAPRTSYDAVVVGAGPNGLTAACTLAAAGRSVLVVEANDTIGGGCRSAELTLPGLTHDVCAAVFALAAASPVFRDLGIESLGVEWAHPDIPLAHPLDDGRAGVLHRSIDETAAALGPDGQAWQRLLDPSLRQWHHLLPHLLGPITAVPRHPFALGRFGLHAAQPATWVTRRFDDEPAAALFAGCAAHAFLPLTHALSASFGMMLALTAHTVGWPLARGGAQTVPDALAARLTATGGVIETSRPVRSLADLPPHRVALFDTAPRQVAAIAGDALPHRYRRALIRFRPGPAAFKVDYALDGPVPWANADCRRAGTVHVGGSTADIAAAEADVAAGRMPERPFVLVVQPEVADPARSPGGRHTLWTYAHVPHGCTIDATDAIERQIERFAPGFRDRVLARHVISPTDSERRNATHIGGDITGGAHSGLQLLFRPTVSLRPYVTPNPSIVLCSASTPPGGGVHGMCGANAARKVLAGVLR